MKITKPRIITWSVGGILLVLLLVGLAGGGASAQQSPTIPTWEHLSTANGDLPVPSVSNQQTLSLILDVDKNGVNDFVIGARYSPGPSMVWYRRDAAGWTRFVIETDPLNVEAGGAFHDVDGDGDLDVTAGNDSGGNQIWWWENPYPNYAPTTDWTRRFIKNGGANKHHDMLFGNFDDDATTEFVYWNQNVKQLFMVDTPADPRATQPWPGAVAIYTAATNQSEGLTQADVDLDGKIDIVGGGVWLKHNGGTSFTPNTIELSFFTRVAAGQLIPGGRPEIVQVPGDANGPARLFTWNGSAWTGSDLPVGQVIHGHSLAIADVNSDGHQDVFIGEMRSVVGSEINPNARTLVLLGDGAGGFTPSVVATGFGQHESKVGDLDGDGDIDILGKPFIWMTPRLDIWLNEIGNGPAPTSTFTPDPALTPTLTNTPTPPSTATSTPASCLPPFTSWTARVIDSARPHRAVFIDSADLDGDGDKDVVTGAWWYRNPGSPGGVWQRLEVGAPLNQLALLADFDNDGDTDVLGTVMSNASQPQLGNAFVWARNNGAGGFTIHNNIPAGSGDFLQGATMAAFSPGVSEVALSWHNQAGGIEALTVPADPVNTPWTKRTLSATTQGEELSAGDIDRDGDVDLLLGTIWLENLGAGTQWTTRTLFNTSAPPDRNRLADVNGDGRLDAVIGYEAINVAGKLAWYEAPPNPTGLWTERVIASIIGPMSLDVADLDGDADLDVVAGEHNLANPSQGRVFAYRNNNAGASFTQYLVATGDEHHDGTQFVDIDNDGDLDVISIGWGHNRVLLYEHVTCAGPQPTATQSPTPGPTSTHTLTPTPGPTATTSPTPTATATTGQCPAPVPGNVIVNPSFESGTANWTFYTNAAGSFTTTATNPFECAKSAQVPVTTAGTNVQLYQYNVPLQPNTAYKLTVAARSTTGRDAVVYLGKHTSPYTNYGIAGVTLNLTSQWQVFTINFTTAGFTTPVSDARLRFTLDPFDAPGESYYFDAVALAPTSVPTPAPTATATASPTPGATATPSPMPTATATPGPTNTATATPTPGPTSTPSPTPTATATTGQCLAPVPGNVIVNPSFESGTANWTFYTNAAGSFTTTATNPYECAKSAQVAITTAGTNVQLYQYNVPLQPNTAYRLTLAARSTTGRDAVVYLGKHTSPYTNYGIGGVTLNLTPQWQVFTINFTTAGFTTPVSDARLRFTLDPFDAPGESYYFDAVALAPAATSTPTPTATPGPTSTPTPTPTPGPTATPSPTPTATPTTGQCPAPAPGNVVLNPGYELGTANWTFYTNAAGSFTTTVNNPYQCAKSAQVAITTAGTNVQLYQYNVPLQPNTAYRLTVAARSTTGRDAVVYLGKHTSPYTNYGIAGVTLNLTSQWQLFTINFTTTGFTTPVSDARLRFTLDPFDAPGENYFFDAVALAPVAGAVSTPEAAPAIEVWYGQTQSFGNRLGRRADPQKWANILGRVTPAAGVNLTYSLNGGPAIPLVLGPDDQRLAQAGDFNVELDYTDLLPGANQVLITAGSAGGTSQLPVTVNYASGPAWTPGVYTFDWSTAGAVSDLAQVVDGQWRLDGDSVRSVIFDYDRLVALGDMSWRDYTVTVPVTVYSVDPAGYPFPSTGPGVGFLTRWNGHYDNGTIPLTGWSRLGALGWYRWQKSGNVYTEGFQLIAYGNNMIGTNSRKLELGVTYNFKLNIVSSGAPGVAAYYKFKAWPAAEAEPAAWDIEGRGNKFEPSGGSVVLVAHHVDARFGPVTVELASTRPQPTLTVTTTGAGTGVVNQSPPGPTYRFGEDVLLAAAPGAGSVFTGWSGDLAGAANPTAIELFENRSVIAQFGLQ